MMKVNTVFQTLGVTWNLLENGEKLAKERAPIFKRIIRNDPKKALELAVNERIYNFSSTEYH